jgi:RHS repeat-associated protein
VTDSLGNVVSEQRYKAWGETRYSSSAASTDYLYTGQREVSDIGLYFYKARWYDSSLGRFSQADSIVPGAGDPRAWDRYAYVKNNPTKYSDPTGHDVFEDYIKFILQAVDYFTQMGWTVVGHPEDKSIYTNGADLVFTRGKEIVEVLSVELKNVKSTIFISTLGQSPKTGVIGGTLE